MPATKPARPAPDQPAPATPTPAQPAAWYAPGPLDGWGHAPRQLYLIARLLEATRRVVWDYCETHGDECPCPFCREGGDAVAADLTHAAWLLGVSRDLIESDLHPQHPVPADADVCDVLRELADYARLIS